MAGTANSSWVSSVELQSGFTNGMDHLIQWAMIVALCMAYRVKAAEFVLIHPAPAFNHALQDMSHELLFWVLNLLNIQQTQLNIGLTALCLWDCHGKGCCIELPKYDSVDQENPARFRQWTSHLFWSRMLSFLLIILFLAFCLLSFFPSFSVSSLPLVLLLFLCLSSLFFSYFFHLYLNLEGRDVTFWLSSILYPDSCWHESQGQRQFHACSYADCNMLQSCNNTCIGFNLSDAYITLCLTFIHYQPTSLQRLIIVTLSLKYKPHTVIAALSSSK